MDPKQRSPRESSIGSGRARTDHQRFYRAYKACLKCRTRKTRCDITAEEFAAGRPCVRCRREMRECTFPSERRGTGSKPRGTNPRGGPDARRSPPSSSGRRQQARESTPQDPGPGVNGDDNNDETDRQGPQSLAHAPVYHSYSPSRTSGLSTSIALHDQSDGPSHPRNTGDQVFSGGVAESMMRTVVSNGEDALNLLFEAAQTRTDVASNLGSLETDAAGPNNVSPAGVNTTSPAHSTPFSQPAMSTNLSAEAIDCWRAYRFTKMGWFSAEEAITYIDLFFQNMGPLSPIVDDFYADHANHYFLITREPLLCCMMITISSRYNVLPVSGGESRGHMIHARMWDHCQHLMMRILLGQEKASKAKTRTIGSIEALLLLTEWQPRALHVPPAADGWDSDIMLTLQDQRDGGTPDVDNPSRGRWLEDVINPARRFDRLAWMAVGLAMSLAHELGLFETDEADAVSLDSLSVYDRRYHQRRRALASILCSYQEQLSARLGRKSMMPQSVSHGVLSFNSASTTWGKRGEDWGSVMAAWTELTKLSRSISDMLFPSATVTKHLLQSGRYISMIEHFCSLLADWERRHKNAAVSKFPFALVLEVEHLFTRIYANSLGLQAVVERTMAEPGADPANSQFELSSTDYGFIQAVVDGCLGILTLSVKMHEQNSLRFAPITIYLRITTASVFLLKGLGLGVSMTKLQDSLDVLTRAISALRSSRPDDLHLGSRYATLLEMHVVALKENFVPTLRPPRFTAQPGSEEDGQIPRSSSDFGDTDWSLGLNAASKFPAISFGGGDGEGFQEDWLTLPFDPSLQPYAPDEMQDFQLLGDNSLDFIWNLGP